MLNPPKHTMSLTAITPCWFVVAAWQLEKELKDKAAALEKEWKEYESETSAT